MNSVNVCNGRKRSGEFKNVSIETSNNEVSENISPPTKKVSTVISTRLPLMNVPVNLDICSSSTTLITSKKFQTAVCGSNSDLTDCTSGGSAESSNNANSDESTDCSIFVYFKNLACCLTLTEELWAELCLADLKVMERVDSTYFGRHPNLLPHYRAILLDWLIEVCDIYSMTRDTFYLTVDYLDRYLSTVDNYPRDKLQQLGITCLMVASKMEEVKPIPLADLLYMTDNSVTSKEVIMTERHILETLNWTQTMWTANRWLCLYLHMMGEKMDQEKFSLVTRLLDLSLLDVQCLQFSYRVLAATCLQLTCLDFPFRMCPGDDLDLNSCLIWMGTYWKVLQNNATKISYDSQSNQHCQIFRNLNLMQKYSTFMCMYEEAKDLMELQSMNTPLTDEQC